MLHSCSDERSFRNKEWHRLTLHVRSHERTVGVIVLKERNESRRNRNYLFRGYVHVVNAITRHSQDVIGLFVITNDNILIFKRIVLIQHSVCLSNNVVIFFIRSQICNLISYLARLWIYPAIWRFDEAIFVNTSKCRQGVDQTDVRTFRCFDRTHTTIVRRVNVTHFKAGTLTSQTTRSER
ncbi:hypothetical protein D3C73_1226590 [compost metagenome]